MPDDPPATPQGAAEAESKRLTRRAFLRGTAGTVGALVLQRAFQWDVVAQREQQEGFQFFTPGEGETFAAVAARIWPGDDEDPGAIEAGAATYVDRALAGPYAFYQNAYRNALAELDDTGSERFGSRYADLDEEQQDTLLAELEARPEEDDPLPQWAEPQARFGPSTVFELFRRHVMEGVFCDPVHGGNRNFNGWRVVNYPGAHYIYSAEEQQVFEPLAKPFQSVADL